MDCCGWRRLNVREGHGRQDDPIFGTMTWWTLLELGVERDSMWGGVLFPASECGQRRCGEGVLVVRKYEVQSRGSLLRDKLRLPSVLVREWPTAADKRSRNKLGLVISRYLSG